ncbi:MAG: hypothetical protein H5T69_11260 [Chloroflexi bacterium]|nr:hypothetical protein [Chloroflexota bacterium]
MRAFEPFQNRARKGAVRFLRDEQGAELIEWALLALLVALASYIALEALRDEVAAVFVRLLGRFLH